eukprot:Sro825_g207660.2  (287) ;mRNA; r:15141-16001
MTKAWIMKPKKRNRKKSSSKDNNSVPMEVVPMEEHVSEPTPSPAVVGCINKPQVARGSSATTWCSSAHLSEPFMVSPSATDVTTTSSAFSRPSPLKPCQNGDEMDVEDTTWNSSDDAGSCPSSPLPVRHRRPAPVRQRAVSLTSGLHHQYHHQEKDNQRRDLMQLHHSQSTSFRLRKRNRALSDADFDQLLTMSRGWSYDPAEPSKDGTHHNRSQALGSTDFDRYIFAPTAPKTRSQSTTAVMYSPRRASLARTRMHSSDTAVVTTAHPFFRPIQDDENLAPFACC